jgi:outer membrane protein TolC
VAGGPSYTRSKTPAAERGSVAASTTGVTSNNFALSGDATWAPDLWGKIWNEVREAQYAAQVSAADLENERLSEQAALAQYYFLLRGQDALQDIYTEITRSDQSAV